MPDKIYIEGESIVIDDNATGVEKKAYRKKSIYYSPERLNNNNVIYLYYIDGLEAGKPFYSVDLSNSVDLNGTAYTKSSFTQFAHINLGYTSAGRGDMIATIYDPQNIRSDVFDYGNFLGTFQINGGTTTLNMSSDFDNLNLDGYNIVYLTSGSQDRRITGIVAPPAGVNRVICFINTSSQFRIKLVHQSGSSLVNNRIVTRSSSGTRNLLQNQAVFVIYDHNLNKWHHTRMA
jgi:hypothetical protein